MKRDEQQELTPQEVLVKIHTTLDGWKEEMSRKNRYELGDDPTSIAGIVVAAGSLLVEATGLGKHFELTKGVSLAEANKFFTLIHQLETLVNLTEAIRDSDFGSSSNTRGFLKQVNKCLRVVGPVEEKFR
ncbi:hypothetical protein HYS82_03385 [Candidatus Amesbacteria bacterium]|nr:hypothetical protein [Candidatus Amesbacteria bacterium]